MTLPILPLSVQMSRRLLQPPKALVGQSSLSLWWRSAGLLSTSLAEMLIFSTFVFSVCPGVFVCKRRSECEVCFQFVGAWGLVWKYLTAGQGGFSWGVGPIKREGFSSPHPEGRSGFNKAGGVRGTCHGGKPNNDRLPFKEMWIA